MTTKARDYSDPVQRRLYSLSGNQCAFPGCATTFFNSGDETNISHICHIEAAKPGGQRYNPDSTDEYRRSYENLILLCPNHHKETDNVTLYPSDVLRTMKREHEDKIKKLVSEQNILKNHPSALNTVIMIIGSAITEFIDADGPENAPDLEHKISYNNVLRYEHIIKTYAAYQGKLNRIYAEIEKQGSSRKEIILKNINTLYLKEKGKYKTFEDVKVNADNIIEAVEKELWKVFDNSNNIVDLDYEAISISILVVLVDAFMRCNILEEPPKL